MNETFFVHVFENSDQKDERWRAVADQIRAQLERERTLEVLRNRADELLAQLRDGEQSPEGEQWASYEDVVRDQTELSRPVLAEAFSLPAPGEDGFSFGSAEDGSDLVIVALSEVTDGDVEEGSEDVKNMSLFLAQLNGQQEYQAYVQTLRDQAEVERP